ncbi:MAG: hypothetical protein HOV79_05670 [Hamadaea sp.]|nr:hypothetical protein [Hamadaea sp.]
MNSNPPERPSPAVLAARGHRRGHSPAQPPGMAHSAETGRTPGYTDVRELGRSATGRVVLARPAAPGFPVAIRYLSGEVRRDQRRMAVVRADVHRLAMLHEQHLVQVIELVETPHVTALVTELADGVNLHTLLKVHNGPLGPQAALTVFRHALLGLRAAHGAGVRCGYRPENVIVDGDGRCRIVVVPSATEPSPPLAHDLYTAAATCYTCLTGTPPQLGAATGVPQPRPEDVPQGLHRLLLRSLAADPAQRPQSADELLRDLDRAAEQSLGTGWESTGVAVLALHATLLADRFPLSTAQNGRPRALRVALAAAPAAGVALAAILVLTGFGLQACS